MDRMISFLAAMCFALPTAGLLWFMSNKQLALFSSGDSFLGSPILWAIVIIFAVLALIYKDLFPSLIGKVWQLMIKLVPWL